MNKSPAERIAAEINRILKENPKSDLSNNSKLIDTLDEILELDRSFAEKGGIFFETGSDAFETAKKFTQIHMEQYRDTGRPSLPALAVHHAEKMSIDKNTPEYKALILVAVRAEMKAAASPDYHSKSHYVDVAAMTANLLEKNNEMAKNGVEGFKSLTKKEQAITLIAAIGHDLDHEGKTNPKDYPTRNEERSFQLMEPLLLEAGLSEEDMGKINVILITTSPDGPHAILKFVAAEQRGGRAVDFAGIKDSDKFMDLKMIVDDLHLMQMAAIVSDADLYASGGAGMDANVKMSSLLTSEFNKSGIPADLTTDSARKYFLDNIVGADGFASAAGRLVGNKSFEALRAETNKRLAKPPSP